MKKIILLMVLIAAFVTSCESKTYDEISKPVTNPTYEANVQPVMAAECVSCHGGSEQQSPLLETYQQVKGATQTGALLCKIQGSCGDIMPPTGKMSHTIVNMINLWNEHGCPEK